jgi:23S rRNA (guanosine2251-2'-O)-methyltransferase
MKTKAKHILILDNIRSVFNVGSLFRIADCVGINQIFLCGITPSPKDRFGKERGDLAKVALGAEKSVAWDTCEKTLSLVKKLKREGYKIIAIEQDKKSIDYKTLQLRSGKAAFILGEETKGISKQILKYADLIAEIPLTGEKESLNVSVAGAVVLFRILNR